MQVHTNDRAAQQKIYLSLVYLVLALGFLLGGCVLSSNPEAFDQSFVASLASLAAGLFFWWLNQRLIRRWGPKSRLDGPLARALRGLDDRHHLFVFPASSLPDYLLVGPVGILVLVPRAIGGNVKCYEGRWLHDDNRPPIARAIRFLAPGPPLGNPSAEVQRGISTVRRFLGRHAPAELADRTGVDGIVVFTEPKVNLTLQGCRTPALSLRSLRSHIQRSPRALSSSETADLARLMGG
ncbi:MAG: hypothetical protein HW416_312 [Chloroflexi bacterium]|nr:hypothetical protein [Chloroflexota bacterium]